MSTRAVRKRVGEEERPPPSLEVVGHIEKQGKGVRDDLRLVPIVMSDDRPCRQLNDQALQRVELVVEHPDVAKIGFTGSTEVGRTVMEGAAATIKRVTLELGGKSPDVVFADADLRRAVAGASMGVFANSGQACCAGTRIFVERPIYDEFVERAG